MPAWLQVIARLWQHDCDYDVRVIAAVSRVDHDEVQLSIERVSGEHRGESDELHFSRAAAREIGAQLQAAAADAWRPGIETDDSSE